MIGYTGRTASGMVKDMLCFSTTYKASRIKSEMDSISLPSTPESSQQDSVFSLEDETEDPLARSLQLSAHKDSPSKQPNFAKVHSLSSSLSVWRMPEELGERQDQFLPLDSGRESDHDESDSESTISSVSSVRSFSKESESSSSNGGGLSSEESATGSRDGQKGGGRMSPEIGGNKRRGQPDSLRLDPGYCTLPHPPRNGGTKAARKGKLPAAFKRISTIANTKKRKSISADISSPSPAHTPTSTPDNAAWSGRRQKAIRRTKLGGSFGKSDHVQPVIHESSYSFQIQSVTVIFRENFKMIIDCRGTTFYYKITFSFSVSMPTLLSISVSLSQLRVSFTLSFLPLTHEVSVCLSKSSSHSNL